jgi:hypothetical protein
MLSAEGVLFFPSLLESTLFIHNLFSLCLVLGVLHLDEPIQVFTVCLLFKAGVLVARLFSVRHLGLEVGKDGSLFIYFFHVHLLDDVNGFFRAKVRFFVFDVFIVLLTASFLILSHLSENVFLILLVCLQLELTLRHGQVLFFLNVVEEVVSLLVAFVGQLHEVLLETIVGCVASTTLVVVHFLAFVFGVSIYSVRTL